MNMNSHPIDGLMETAMNSIKDMIDVNTIIGEPIETSNGMVIIPISKVCFGFAAGGSEFKGETVDEYKKKEKEEEVLYRLPFGGGSGAGISIVPVAFVIVLKDTIKLLPVEHNSAIERLMDYVPDLMEKANCIVDKTMDNSKKENKKCNNNENNNSQSTNENPTPQNNNNNNTQVKNESKVTKNKIIKKIKKPIEDIEETIEETNEFFENE